MPHDPAQDLVAQEYDAHTRTQTGSHLTTRESDSAKKATHARGCAAICVYSYGAIAKVQVTHSTHMHTRRVERAKWHFTLIFPGQLTSISLGHNGAHPRGRVRVVHRLQVRYMLCDVIRYRAGALALFYWPFVRFVAIDYFVNIRQRSVIHRMHLFLHTDRVELAPRRSSDSAAPHDPRV